MKTRKPDPAKDGKRAASPAHKTLRTFPAPIADSRTEFARALRALRGRKGGRAQAGKLRGVERAAWQVALAKARFLRDGTAYLTGADGARLTRAQASKRLVVKAATRDGTGRAVEWQTLAEMHAAARAELIAARLAGHDGMTEANRAANAELHHAARERIFHSAHKAELGAARAHAADSATHLQGCAEYGRPQPHAAEFLLDAPARGESAAALDAMREDQSIAPCDLVKRATVRAVNALRAFYAAKKYPRARKDHARDLRSLRGHARAIAGGEVIALKWREEKAASERARDLGIRVQAGMELLAFTPAHAPARKPAPAPARVPVITIPTTRAEWCAHDLALGIGEGARLLALRSPSRAELATLATWKPGMQ